MQAAILRGFVAAPLTVGVSACNDSTRPSTGEALAGRYAVVAVDGKSPPGFVSASVSNPAYGYDSAWMQADTLSLLPDSTAEEMGVFSYKWQGKV